jgi:hypothetical protein
MSGEYVTTEVCPKCGGVMFAGDDICESCAEANIPRKAEGEVVALARPRGQAPGGEVVEQIRQHVEKASLAMELRWEEERKLREKWDEEDKLEGHRVTLTAMIAAGVLGEGAAGNRMRSDQLAQMACEYADAILRELPKYIHRDKLRREAERKSIAAEEAAKANKTG